MTPLKTLLPGYPKPDSTNPLSFLAQCLLLLGIPPSFPCPITTFHLSHQDHFQCHLLCPASPGRLSEQKINSSFPISTVITPHCKFMSPRLVMSRGPETIFFFLCTTFRRHLLNAYLSHKVCEAFLVEIRC